MLMFQICTDQGSPLKHMTKRLKGTNKRGGLYVHPKGISLSFTETECNVCQGLPMLTHSISK